MSRLAPTAILVVLLTTALGLTVADSANAWDEPIWTEDGLIFPEGAVSRTNDRLHALLDGVAFSWLDLKLGAPLVLGGGGASNQLTNADGARRVLVDQGDLAHDLPRQGRRGFDPQRVEADKIGRPTAL